MAQNDLKKVIAYSTCSQLGYMVMACGVSNYLYDILFFIRCLKETGENNAFSIRSYVSFSNSNTRSTTHLKLKHSLSKTHVAGHFYTNRLPRLWNSLPPLNPDLSLHTIKKNIWQFFWSKFENNFQNNVPCSFHFLCPCSRCVSC